MRKDVFSDLAVTKLAQLIYKIVEPFSSDVQSLKLLAGIFYRLMLVRARERLLLFTIIGYVATAPRALRLERLHYPKFTYLFYNIHAYFDLKRSKVSQ